MKTKKSTIKLLKKDQGCANCVETTGIYESNVLGKYEWGIFHNSVGVRWYVILKISKKAFIHIFEKPEYMITYIKRQIL